MIQIISHYSDVTQLTTILANLFSSLWGNSNCSETNIAKLNSVGPIIPIVKTSTLLTGTSSAGK